MVSRLRDGGGARRRVGSALSALHQHRSGSRCDHGGSGRGTRPLTAGSRCDPRRPLRSAVEFVLLDAVEQGACLLLAPRSCGRRGYCCGGRLVGGGQPPDHRGRPFNPAVSERRADDGACGGLRAETCRRLRAAMPRTGARARGRARKCARTSRIPQLPSRHARRDDSRWSRRPTCRRRAARRARRSRY